MGHVAVHCWFLPLPLSSAQILSRHSLRERFCIDMWIRCDQQQSPYLMRCGPPVMTLEYCPDTKIGIENRDVPSTWFGERLNVFLSVCTVDLSTRPTALQIILQNNAESAFFQTPFDMFSKFIHSALPRVATAARSRGGTHRFRGARKASARRPPTNDTRWCQCLLGAVQWHFGDRLCAAGVNDREKRGNRWFVRRNSRLIAANWKQTFRKVACDTFVTWFLRFVTWLVFPTTKLQDKCWREGPNLRPTQTRRPHQLSLQGHPALFSPEEFRSKVWSNSWTSCALTAR